MNAVEKEFDGKLENIPHILDFIGDFTNQYSALGSLANKFLIVGDELFSNIIKYGYENKGGPILVKLAFDEGINEFTLTIIDQAKEFNQLSVNVDNSKDKVLRIGGLGISIVKNIMSECRYDYIDGQNILTLKKKV